MKIPERKDADKKYTWRTEDLFATDEIWEQHYNELDKKAGKIEELQNTCTKDDHCITIPHPELDKSNDYK